MPENTNKPNKTLRTVANTKTADKGILPTIKECHEKWGPASPDYDPVELANCIRAAKGQA